MVMNRLCDCFLRALGCVVFPLCLLGFRVSAKRRGLKRFRVGKLSVWGDSGFLELCKASIERLNTLDPGLHRALTSQRWAWVLQDRKGTGDAPPRLFAINPSYAAWEAEGVVARLVYAAFCITVLSERRTFGEEFRSTHQKAMNNCRSWLQTRGFPEELAACFAVT
jgi:hypothetical protein